MDKASVIRKNIEWFRNSGIMRPNDGFWGVGERIVVADGNEALEKINKNFYCQTVIAPHIISLEHRRADCNLETALMFDLAAEVLQDNSLREIANHIIGFLVDRSALRHITDGDPTKDLWGWSMPLSSQWCWTDDNSWVVTLLLTLSERGRPELREAGVAAARTFRRLMADYYSFLDRHGKNTRPEKEVMPGTNLSPHWLGLTTMAFAHAAAIDKETDYTEVIEKYYKYAPSGPPEYIAQERGPTTTGLPWTLSEYGYLAMVASVVADSLDLPEVRDVAKSSADVLVEHQFETGHFAAEHDEAPIAPHLADMIYTQNWATLGLYHAWLLFDLNPQYRRAFDKSLTFLAEIQDDSSEPWFNGCWRGLYDTKAQTWGGGDRWEGGQGSIYSGWTNAPISLAFLFDITGESLFAGNGPESSRS
jgi:hypothetical protein